MTLEMAEDLILWFFSWAAVVVLFNGVHSHLREAQDDIERLQEKVDALGKDGGI